MNFPLSYNPNIPLTLTYTQFLMHLSEPEHDFMLRNELQHIPYPTLHQVILAYVKTTYPLMTLIPNN